MIGAAGISAFPMSSRVIQKMATDEDPQNFILMHAAGANVSKKSLCNCWWLTISLLT